MRKFLLSLSLLAVSWGALQAGGGSISGGSGTSDWNGLSNVPAGFADGVDNDTGGGLNTWTDGGSNNIYLTTGTKAVGIGTTAPGGYSLNVTGDMIVTSSLTVSGNALLSARLGIGTTLPSYGLHVVGDVLVTSSMNVNGHAVVGSTLTVTAPITAQGLNIGQQLLSNNLSISNLYGDYIYRIVGSTTSSNSFLRGLAYDQVSGGTMAFMLNGTTTPVMILYNGNVGIGYTAPQTALRVQGDNALGTAIFDNGAGASNLMYMRLMDLGSTYGYLAVGRSANNFMVGSAQGDTMLMSVSTTSKTHLGAGQSAALYPNLTIYTAGNDPRVGIATTLPAYRLEVSSGAGFTGTIAAVSTGGVAMIQLQGDGDVIANRFIGDGSQLTGVSGSGDMVLASTQTSTGAKTFQSFTVMQASLTATSAGFSGVVTVSSLTATGDITAPNFKGLGGSFVVNNPAASSSVFVLSGGTMTLRGDGIQGSAGTTYIGNSASSTAYALGNSSMSLNGWLVGVTTQTVTVNISTDPTNGFTSRAEPILQVPTGRTWTITKVMASALPSGTTVQFNLEERANTSLGSAGTDVFTVTDATATVGGVNNVTGITSFSNSSIASDAWLVATTPSAGAGAGGPNRLLFTIYYLEQ